MKKVDRKLKILSEYLKGIDSDTKFIFIVQYQKTVDIIKN